jgi:hypothetical protein
MNERNGVTFVVWSYSYWARKIVKDTFGGRRK